MGLHLLVALVTHRHLPPPVRAAPPAALTMLRNDNLAAALLVHAAPLTAAKQLWCDTLRRPPPSAPAAAASRATAPTARLAATAIGVTLSGWMPNLHTVGAEAAGAARLVELEWVLLPAAFAAMNLMLALTTRRMLFGSSRHSDLLGSPVRVGRRDVGEFGEG